MTKCKVILCGCCAVLLCAANDACAQAPRESSSLLPASHASTAVNAAHPGLAGLSDSRKRMPPSAIRSDARAPVPAETTTQPARLFLSNGELTVEANNSDLAQILHDLARVSGMTISGLNNGPRIFGVYGPGNSRDVLAALLAGAGYNFIMVGGAPKATPRELLLTRQGHNSSAIAPLSPRSLSSVESDQFEERSADIDPPIPIASGPGAISPAPSQDDRDDDTRAQQNLQRLQHLQEQQQSTPQ